MPHTLKLDATDINIGQSLPWGIYDSGGLLLLKKGMVVQSDKQLNILLKRGIFRQVQTNSGTPENLTDENTSPFTLINNFTERLRASMQGIIAKKSNMENELHQLANDIQSLCKRDPDAMLGAIHLYHNLDYTYNHPVHNAILCEIFSDYLGLENEQRRLIICAALTANISVLKLQDTLHSQSTDLTDEQKREMEAHPINSTKLLRAAGIEDEHWLRTIEQHHERSDGSGYPNGLSDDEISDDAKIVALTDIYTAMVVSKSYRNAHPGSDILRVLFINKGKEHDEELCLQLIKIMGVFPPGSFVKLKNGETAVVTHRAKGTEMWPKASTILNAKGAAYFQPIQRDCNVTEFKIKEMCSIDKNTSLNLHLLWNYSFL